MSTLLVGNTVVWMGSTVRKRRRRRQGCLHQRKGSARFEIGSFETLEARSLLSADGLGGVDMHSHSHSDHAEAVAIDPDVEIGHDLVATEISQSSSSLPPNQLPKLHSHETATQKIFLDFTGHVVHGTGWNELNRGQPIHAPAFDIDGDDESFSPTEVQLIEEIWARVAEDFAPFDLDVTTEAPSVRSLRAGSEAMRVLISTNVDSASGRQWFSSGTGVAYMNSWGSQTDTPAWVFANRLGASAKRIAESVSHELGHAFGLDHDGTGVGDGTHDENHEEHGEEYYYGHGDAATGWAPIMGIGYNRPVTQWNSGEYMLSSNSQDDIATIASERNNIQVRTDDHADQIAFAQYIETGIAGQASQSGLISTRHDRDIFRLDLESGAINVMVAGASVGSNLDIEVSLFDAEGSLLKTFGTDDSLSVAVHADVSAGTYYLGIDGVGRGDPASDGYSDYGSLGQYSITGLIPTYSESRTESTAAFNSHFRGIVLAAIRAQARQYLLGETSDEEERTTDTADRWRPITPQVDAIMQARAAARRLRSRFV